MNKKIVSFLLATQHSSPSQSTTPFHKALFTGPRDKYPHGQMYHFGPLQPATLRVEQTFIQQGPIEPGTGLPFNYKVCVTDNCDPKSIDLFPMMARKFAQSVIDQIKTGSIPYRLQMPANLLSHVKHTRHVGEKSRLERTFYVFHQIIEVLLAPAYSCSLQIKPNTDPITKSILLKNIREALNNANLFLLSFNSFLKGAEFLSIRGRLTGASGAQSPIRSISMKMYGNYDLDDPEFLRFLQSFSEQDTNTLFDNEAFRFIPATTKKILKALVNATTFDQDCVTAANNFKGIFEALVQEIFPPFFGNTWEKGWVSQARPTQLNQPSTKPMHLGSDSDEQGLDVRQLIQINLELVKFRMTHVSIVAKQIKQAYQEDAIGTGGSPIRGFLATSLMHDVWQLSKLTAMCPEENGLSSPVTAVPKHSKL